MKIKKALFSPGTSGFFFDDQRAIKQGAPQQGLVYKGSPATPGFRRIRQAGESISVLLKMENGDTACGDCTAVQYSGAGGRDPLFTAQKYLPLLNSRIRPLLEGKEIASFREAADYLDGLSFNGKKLHTAVRYGLTQAVLDAGAKVQKKLKSEVLCEEYNLPVAVEPVPIFGQSGDQRYTGVDKMILKKVDVLPHGLINDINTKLGTDGGKLLEYLNWVCRRIKEIRARASYQPVIHIDVYGTIGIIFSHNLEKIVNYLLKLEKAAGEFQVYIEGPVDMEEKGPQIEFLGKIKKALEKHSSGLKIVADEWCNSLEDIKDFAASRCCHMVQIKTPDLGGIQNTVESILFCKNAGVEAYQGGSCNETDMSSRVCVHVAMAARPDRLLAKPGMGFDEGYSIVNNEMQRIITVLRDKYPHQ